MHNSGTGSYQFDMKETVRLTPNQLPIEEIEELELIPQVQIEERGDEIEITGSLYLYGNYRGNQEAGKLDATTSTPDSYEESVQFEPLSIERGPFSPLAKEDKFEHRIPVRITLPKGKVREIADVYAFINSFDYDLVTPYQIDVIASLVISGFVEKEEEMKEEKLFPDPLEFVHISGENQVDFSSNPVEAKLNALDEQISRLEESNPIAENEELAQQDESEREEDSVLASVVEDRLEPEEIEESRVETSVEVETQTNLEVERDNVVQMPYLVEDQHEAEEEPEQTPPEEDVKVAISGKGTKEDRETISSLSSIFSRLPKKEDVSYVETSERTDQENEEQENDALYLTNFMENNQEQFTKIKICIIQKNETIDDIADRYKLQVETILRANQAERNQLAAGQILYIPVKG